LELGQMLQLNKNWTKLISNVFVANVGYVFSADLIKFAVFNMDLTSPLVLSETSAHQQRFCAAVCGQNWHRIIMTHDFIYSLRRSCIRSIQNTHKHQTVKVNYSSTWSTITMNLKKNHKTVKTDYRYTKSV